MMEKLLSDYRSRGIGALTAGRHGSKQQAWQWEWEAENSQPQPQVLRANRKHQ